MPKLIVLVGPPGSGKSTFGKKLKDELFVYVNQDSQGKQEHLEYFNAALGEGHNIVVDRMNFNVEQRKRYLDPAKALGYTTEIQVFHESRETCYERCTHRKNHETIKDGITAAKVLDFFFSRYETVRDEEADAVIRHYPKQDKPFAVVCDLDGTLCNVDHRLHHVRAEKGNNWRAFFAGIKYDTINTWCAWILDSTDSTEKVVLCSGRPNTYKTATIDWLLKHDIDFDTLFMRPEKDMRRDDTVKEIILDFEILTRYTPIMMIDDRQQVVNMWRKRGFVCLQCAQGDF